MSDTEAHSPGHSAFLDTEEARLFTLGCCLLILWFASIAVLWRIQSDLWLQMLTMGVAHLAAGRAVSIAEATRLKLHPALIATLASYFDCMVMFIAYPILIYSYKHLLERRFFKEHMFTRRKGH